MPSAKTKSTHSPATLHHISKDPLPKKDWTTRLATSDLNWSVEKRPLFDERGKQLPILGTFRSDNNRFLGTVGEQYRIIQNSEILSIGNQLRESGLDVDFEKANCFFGGQGVWFSFRLPIKIDVGHVGDIIEAFLIISTKHDGKGSLFFEVHTNRLICTNGARALNRHQLSFIRHTISADEKINQARDIITASTHDLDSFSQLMNIMAKTKMTTEAMRKSMERIFYKDEEHNLYTSAQKQNIAREVLGLFEMNDMDAFKQQRGTAYALFQSFTRYADHHMTSRIAEGENETQSKMRSALFGVGEVLKMRALSEIVRVMQEMNLARVPEKIVVDFGAK